MNVMVLVPVESHFTLCAEGVLYPDFAGAVMVFVVPYL